MHEPYRAAGMPLLLVSAAVDPPVDAEHPGALRLRPGTDELVVGVLHHLHHAAGVKHAAVVHDQAGGRIGWKVVTSLQSVPPGGR
ncbi:hypothetical protein [Streptomyces sp. NPDC058486]|uniref:hypothetical protein n=1 Tax=unclassified Streptomyces TaxID=2593676 RepID=UPI0036594E2B